MLAWAQEQPFDDVIEPHVRGPRVRERGEEPPQPGVVVTEARVDNDQPEVVSPLKKHLETLGKEHQRGPVRVVRGGEELWEVAPPQLEIEQHDVRRKRRSTQGGVDGVSE